MWKGMKYPAQAGDRGLFAGAVNDELIKGNIMQILGTRKGERAMLPLFGTRIWEYIHEPLDAPTMQFIRMEITDAIEEWEDRAILKDVILTDYPEQGLLRVKIIYAIEQSQEDYETDIKVTKSGGVSQWL